MKLEVTEAFANTNLAWLRLFLIRTFSRIVTSAALLAILDVLFVRMQGIWLALAVVLVLLHRELEAGGSIEKKPGARKTRVGSSDNDHLFLFGLGNR